MDSIEFTVGVSFSTDFFRALLLFVNVFGVAEGAFGVEVGISFEGVVFGVTFGLGSDFVLAEPLTLEHN